eukprot:1274394-Rhodomonas_salina.1
MALQACAPIQVAPAAQAFWRPWFPPSAENDHDDTALGLAHYQGWNFCGVENSGTDKYQEFLVGIPSTSSSRSTRGYPSCIIE